MAARTQRTVPGNGVSIAVAETGDRAGPPVVFIHGYPDTKEMWDLVIGGLPERFHAVAYDVRGAGSSSVPRGAAAYDFERLGDDLLSVLDAVAPGARVHLVGHDWGGLQGWEFATQSRFEGRLASFTAIAAPSLDQLALAGEDLRRSGRVLEGLVRARRSWYVLLLLAPGGPSLWWRVLGARGRWQRMLELAERVPVGDGYPAPTLVRDGLAGANLYRRNMPRRLLRPRRDVVAHVPVQLIVPSGDRHIPHGYYERVERHAPRLRRRVLGTGHWAPRTQPELLARWISSFVDDVEDGGVTAVGPGQWVRGAGVEQLSGRLALVTGAGSGIGEASARALAAHGARVLLVDRDSEAVARVADSIPGSARYACDVGDAGAMEALVDRVVREHGAPQVVLNNAGIGLAGPFLDTGFEDWRRIVDINLMGVVYGCRLFGRAMVERGEGGQIVNVSSAAAFTPSRSLPAYSTTKAAVLMASECLRAELARSGIGVTAVCPGFVATDMTRTSRWVGRSEQDQARLSAHVTRQYARRNFTPERVADEIIAAIGADLPVAVVTPEAKLMRALSRLAPGVLRRLARLDTTPV